MTRSLRGVASIFFALFFLASGATVAHAQSATNLIQNPGLETTSGAVPANWTKTYWGTPTPTFKYPDTGHSGNGATITFGANSNGDARWAHAPVAVEANGTYVFSSWYKSNVATEVDIEFTTANGTKTYGFLTTLPSSNNTWQQYTANIQVSASAAKIVVFHLIDKKGTLTVDDYSLVKSGGTPPPPNAPTLTFTASPTTISTGATSTLSWQAQNATGCTASNGWTGTQSTNGTTQVNPVATTTYALDCTGAGGSVHKEVTVGVKVAGPPPASPTLNFTASPTKVNQGQASTLTWSSTNATGCTATNGWTGSKATSGSESVTPSATTTYMLSCSGAGGSISKSVTVNFVPTPVTPPPAGSFPEGMVTLSFDDSWISQYTTVLPILQTAGFKGTFYLTTQPIQEGWDDYMTPANVQDIAAKGHEIAGHTVTHADLTTLSQTKIKAEIKNSKTYLESLTGKVVNAFAYPYGALNNTVKTLVKNAGYTSARGVDYETENVATTDKYELKSQCIETSDSTASIKAQIDAAKANKQWYILCIHEVKTGGDQYTMTPARFQEIVDYIKQSGVKVVTVQQGRALMQ